MYPLDKVLYCRVYCSYCKYTSYLTREQYDEEMNKPDTMWPCNHCGVRGAHFDDEYWEKNVGITEDV